MSKKVSILRKWLSALIVSSIVLSLCNMVTFAALTAEDVISAESGDMLWVRYTNNAISNEENTDNYWRVVAGDYVNGSWSKIIIAKFDIANLSCNNIREAYISFGAAGTAGANYDIREITSDWTAATVSAGTSPAISASSLATFTSVAGSSTYNIDLTDYVAELKAENKTELNIAITGNGTDLRIRQTDDGDLLYPRLYVTSTDVSAPSVKLNAASYVQADSSLSISADVVDDDDLDLTVDFYLDDVKYEDEITNAGDNYSITLADGLTEGAHSVKVIATNSNGMSKTVTKNIQAVDDINATTVNSVSFVTKNYLSNYDWDWNWHIYNNTANSKSCVWLMYADLSGYVNKPILDATFSVSINSQSGIAPVFGIHEVTDSASWYTEAGNQISTLPTYSETPVMQFTNQADNTWRRINIDLTDYVNSLIDEGRTELNLAFTVDNNSAVNTYITYSNADETRKVPEFKLTTKNYGEKPKVSAVSGNKYYLDNEAFDFDVSITGDVITEVKAFIDETEITCENINDNTYRCEVPALAKGNHVLKVRAKNTYNLTTTFRCDLYCGKYTVTQQSFTDASGEEFVFANGNTIKNNLRLINCTDSTSCLLIVALYGADDEFLAANPVTCPLVKGENDISASLAMPTRDSFEDCYVKAFVWDNATNAMPLTNAYMYDNE